MKNYHNEYLEQALLRYVHENLHAAVQPVTNSCQRKTMSILRYLQPRDGLPDPKGPLSNTLLRSASDQIKLRSCAKLFKQTAVDRNSRTSVDLT